MQFLESNKYFDIITTFGAVLAFDRSFMAV